ncbi:MAG TPA: hypothetical protein PKA60_00240 [Candidatus Paceibacterota bacterium]|nr:hypothetical protein [Candidatus Paceibacterota bacterium]
MSLKQISLKIKCLLLLSAILLPVDIFLILSIKKHNNNEDIVISNDFYVDFSETLSKNPTNQPQIPNNQTENNQKGTIVASKNGTKYYFLHCSGVSRIKEENKIFFSDKNKAEEAGYSVAANCK